MSKREAKLLLEDIWEAIGKIEDYTQAMSFEQFIKDSKTVDAVIRNFEIIGEATIQLPEEFRLKHSNIDWHRLKGFRNRLVHDYFGVDYKIVWDIIQENLPYFRAQIEKLI